MDDLSGNEGTAGQLIQLDRAVALARVGGSMELLQEVARLFLDECPRVVTELRQALEQHDASRVEYVAHSLKGSTSSIGAQAAYEAARELEIIGRSRDLSHAQSAFLVLEDVLTRMKPDLESLCVSV